MHRYLSMALRPSSLIILVGYAAQIVLFSLTLRWYVMVTHLEQHVNLNSENVVTQIQSKIEHSARLIHPMNSTSTNLARLLSPTLNVANISFSNIETKVYVLAVPQNRSVSFVKKNGLTLLIVMIVMFFIAMVSFLNTNARASRREMHLCSSLIKQMEATQQAERKRMNKSLAFASASHDIRASLAALTGLIEMSYEDVTRGSELETNLNQMESCTKDLLGLLNSLLDTSKIEAGKMQLEEEEFDIFQLLEDVVDLYHPVAMKKGVDLVLDPCNGSMLRYSRSKGDRGKLKQVLCNLLSNAVKFTDEGHIAVRAWAQKPSLQNSIIADNQHSFMKNLSCLFSWRNEPHDDDPGAWNPIQQDPSCMDFIFEVDDTGKGIPKEKYKSVFENYVQVKETALGQGGTGLGLGIVQSLVRLMHGDIRIVEKDIGEKGTCFRFNVLLSACETGMASGIREVQSGSDDKNQPQCSGSSICSSSPKLRIRSPSSIPEASQVVLLIQDEERRRITQRFVESLGIKVNVVKHAKHLLGTLRKIKQKGSLSSPLSSDLSSQSASCGSTSRSKRIPLSSMDGNDYINSIFKKTDLEAMSGFILIVIDANAGPFSELCRMVYDFKRGLGNPCKVVWLEKPHMRSVNFKDDVFDSNDIVLSKPFHGTRLFRTIELLPEYGGASQCSTTRAKREHRLQVSLTDEHEIQIDEEEKYGNSRSRKETQQSFGDKSYDRSKAGKSPVRQCEIVECVESRTDKPLSGKKFLVVDDTKMLLNIAKTLLERLGASVEQCEDGILAVQQVEEGLKWDSHNPPYDYILMDYEMPGMNGFEATRKIREMEEPYGLRIPIIALTAHTGEEAKKTIEAGMDDCLSKPIKKEALLEAIRKIHGT
ncbi:hypothetical protein RIF29_24831 [Crotalaria pallida]|uniref:histidine kinase n=1 Tax=Crotalaria pallida TaxID=3830 RepID=A0AAN9EQK8_CROPI